MILTWGLPDDGPVVAVREQCDRLGRAKEFFLLDQSRYADVRGDLRRVVGGDGEVALREDVGVQR